MTEKEMREFYDTYMDEHMDEYGDDGLEDYRKLLGEHLPQDQAGAIIGKLYDLVAEIEFNAFVFGVRAAQEMGT